MNFIVGPVTDVELAGHRVISIQSTHRWWMLENSQVTTAFSEQRSGGEKVTWTQKALLDRYAARSEDLLVGKDFYLCEACGFIFLGTEMPEVCPVCKAPRSRFSFVK